MQRALAGGTRRRPMASAVIALVGLVMITSGCGSPTTSASKRSDSISVAPPTASDLADAAARYESLATTSNCAKKRWNALIDEVYGEDEYIYGDEWPDAGGVLLPEAQRLADAFQAFATGIDDATWPLAVAGEMRELADSLRVSSADYARVAQTDDFDSYRSALGQMSTSIRPTASIREKLGLPKMVGDGCPAPG